MLAYIPQIVRVARDQQGAVAISYTTWWLFALANSSTAAYAVFDQDDLRMAAMFGANAAFCLAVVVLTAYKRMRRAKPISAAPARN